MKTNRHPAEFFNQAAENNKQAILSQLAPRLVRSQRVLEIGTGTGQHAAYFAKACPHLHWQCSDQQANLAAIEYWHSYFELNRQTQPLNYQIGQDCWPCECDAVYTANTAHIMSPTIVQQMYSAIGKGLPVNGYFFHYGPFKQAGAYSSQSNQAFDQMLQQRGYGGLRDIEELISWGALGRLELCEQIDMPANNLLLVWQKR
ncbi:MULTISPECIES: DUF938 domain-containing protein [unclassified Agarivorans]|uniref:DUF938 domain-containing protein n=1 Tax=unclassified Agarivorans TaxID=2636026 RepID=UPI0026E46A16|nr:MULTISPECIES: DUF938 domain-containing protein [unclassified Agarivorans]MDO6687105.1 DUF938 domain-containing protein [Agarivorans sp. 3_MG-2023]MDO6713483.1 DUF938 domain-containing protein [Agarivorans sp. 2_MG-2023]